jgi:hypothetical protein
MVDFITLILRRRGKMMFQLPAGIKKFQKKVIEPFKEKEGGALFAVVFIGGLIVSAADFLCTGQLYLATVIYMTQKITMFGGTAVLSLLLYLTAMNLPSAVIVFLLHKGYSMLQISGLSERWMLVVKLVSGVLFAAFSILIITALL